MLNCVRNPHHQIVVADGPADEIVGAEAGRLEGRIEVTIRGEHQYWDVGRGGSQAPKRLNAIDSRHPDVEQYDVRRMRLESRQRRVATLGNRDVASFGTENSLQKAPIGLAIVNYQKPGIS